MIFSCSLDDTLSNSRSLSCHATRIVQYLSDRFVVFSRNSSTMLSFPAIPFMHDDHDHNVAVSDNSFVLLLQLTAACSWTESLKGFTSLSCVSNEDITPASRVSVSSDAAVVSTSLKSVWKLFFLRRKDYRRELAGNLRSENWLTWFKTWVNASASDETCDVKQLCTRHTTIKMSVCTGTEEILSLYFALSLFQSNIVLLSSVIFNWISLSILETRIQLLCCCVGTSVFFSKCFVNCLIILREDNNHFVSLGRHIVHHFLLPFKFLPVHLVSSLLCHESIL